MTLRTSLLLVELINLFISLNFFQIFYRHCHKIIYSIDFINSSAMTILFFCVIKYHLRHKIYVFYLE